jgi:hypothetical protein
VRWNDNRSSVRSHEIMMSLECELWCLLSRLRGAIMFYLSSLFICKSIIVRTSFRFCALRLVELASAVVTAGTQDVLVAFKPGYSWNTAKRISSSVRRGCTLALMRDRLSSPDRLIRYVYSRSDRLRLLFSRNSLFAGLRAQRRVIPSKYRHNLH